MKRSLRKTKSILAKSRWTLAVAMVVFSALSAVSWLQSRTSKADAVTASHPGLTARTHINNIFASISSYMQKHDPLDLERVKQEGKEANRYIEDVNKTLARQGKKDKVKDVEQTHQALREASVNLLSADVDATLARKEMSAAVQFLGVSLAQFAQRNAHKSEQMRTQVELFTQSSKKLQMAEEKKQTAMDHFVQRSQAVDKVLQATDASPLPSRNDLLFPLLSVCLLLTGAWLVIFVYRQIQKDIINPLAEILQCVDAAATGDLSRMPDHWADDEVGRLSQAVGRLLTVLARSENLVYHLASLVESSGDAIISHTLDGKILSWNKGAQKLYGYSAEEMKGRSIILLTDDDGKQEMMQTLIRIRQNDRIRPFEAVHQAKNGRRVRAFVRVAPIHDSTKQVIGASFIAEELTEAKLTLPKITEHQIR